MNNSTEEQIASVWLSTHSHLQNTWRILNFSDRGLLVLSRNGIRLYGKNGKHRIGSIKELDLTYADFPWGNLFLAVIFALIFLGIVFYFDSNESMKNLIHVFSIVLPISILLQKTSLWIKITYQDESSNSLQFIYLSDGSRLGWGGILGGTLQLYKRLRSFYLEKAG